MMLMSICEGKLFVDQINSYAMNDESMYLLLRSVNFSVRYGLLIEQSSNIEAHHIGVVRFTVV